MSSWISISKSVFRKDIDILKRYKLNLAMMIGSIFFYLYLIFAFSSSFELQDNGSSIIGGNNIYLYLLVGLFVIDMTITCSVPSLSVSFYQTSGIMEELIQDNNKFLCIVSASTIVPLLISFCKFFFYFLFANMFLDESLTLNFMALFLPIVLMTYFFSILGISLIASYFVIVFKRGNPVIQLNTILLVLIGGPFYPTENLSWYLQDLSNFIPGKHTIELVRILLIEKQQNITLLIYHYLFLLALTVFLATFGVFCFKRGLSYTKTNNTVTHY